MANSKFPPRRFDSNYISPHKHAFDIDDMVDRVRPSLRDLDEIGTRLEIPGNVVDAAKGIALSKCLDVSTETTKSV